MAQVQKLHVALLAGALGLLAQSPQTPRLAQKKFFPDDPLTVAPRARNVEKAAKVKLNDLYDLFLYTLKNPAQKQPKTGPPIRALALNTVDEVPDIVWWYENRHWKKRMTINQLVIGPDANNAPSRQGPWKILSLKDQGVTPGFLIEDSRGQRYFLKFDPITNPEMATAADVIGSRFFHAFGYFVPEYYITRFGREQLTIKPGATMKVDTRTVPIKPRDVDRVMSRLAREKDGRFRAVASRLVEGDLLGPFRYHGTRSDDPNDVFPHEHRRDLRGLYVFCAWLGHEDSRSINTLDTLINVDGVKIVRHDLIDFGSTLGSASTKPNPERSGHQHLFAWDPAIKQFLTLGFWTPDWARHKYKYFPSVGRFEWEIFDPDKWFPEYPNPAFLNRLPDDEFWAAKQVMNFTDDEISAIVRMGQYSDNKAREWVTQCLIKRRDKIGKTFFSKVLPIDKFEVRGGELTFVDLAEAAKIAPRRTYTVSWSEFDNDKATYRAIPGEETFRLPAAARSGEDGKHWVADIRGGHPTQLTSVYVRQRGTGYQVVGIDRFW